ncbi:hypothetical protein HG530_006559 [Fusarium avenaceum]|nr:hypothetical protein HG530_006559 [Fusarium avenaceum]
MDAFAQILEMDDGEDDMEFSSSVTGSFLAAETVYPEIDDAINRGDFDEIYSHAHYMFGVASTMGAIQTIDVLLEFPDLIDIDKFSQILEMDDDGDRGYSSSICEAWMEEVEAGFARLEQAINSAEFDKISTYARDRRGTSEALGAIKVSNTFKDLQQLGEREDPTGGGKLDDETALQKAADLLREGREDYKETAALIEKALGVDT